MKATLVLSILLAVNACVSPPRPTAAARALEGNPRAVLEGRVADSQGHPASGLGVAAIPRGKDIAWSPSVLTDSEGRFRLTVFAPARYGFVLQRGKTSVVTDDPRDPSHVHVSVTPGERRTGIDLVFLRERWNEILGSSQ